MGNVTTGKPKVGGAVYVAPIGTALPTDSSTSLNASFKPLGYIAESGLINSNTPDSDVVKAWGGDTVLTVQNDRVDTFEFTLIESMNVEVLKLVYGDDNVTGTLATGITIKANNKSLPSHAIVVEMVLVDESIKRIVIPNGTVTAVGDITYTDTDAVGYDTTITAKADGNGNTHYEYIKAKASS